MQYELPSDPATRPAAIVTVSELLRSVRDTLERRFPLAVGAGRAFQPVARAVRALLLHAEGRRRAGRLRDVPQPRRRARLGAARNGTQVEARALVTLYEPRGRFQLTVEGDAPGRPRSALRALPAAQGEARATRACSTAAQSGELPQHPRSDRRAHLARGGGAARRAHHARAAQSRDRR